MSLETTAERIAKTLYLRRVPVPFASLELARSYAARCVRPMWVVLGDPEYENEARAYVVTPADAAKLERAGYEIAR